MKLALVTGASSGLGKAVATLLAEQNVPLFLTARDEKRLRAVQKELEQKVPVTVHVADLSKREERAGLIQQIRALAPDLVVNNAGFGLYGEALLHATEKNLELVEVDVNALVEITLEAARTLIAQKREGTIINVSSVAAFFTYPTFALYAASKGFVKQFSAALDSELESQGVHVLTFCPGQIATPFRTAASGKPSPTKTDWKTLSVEKAATALLKQAKSMKSVYVFDARYRVFLFLSRLLPPSMIQKILPSKI